MFNKCYYIQSPSMDLLIPCPRIICLSTSWKEELSRKKKMSMPHQLSSVDCFHKDSPHSVFNQLGWNALWDIIGHLRCFIHKIWLEKMWWSDNSSICFITNLGNMDPEVRTLTCHSYLRIVLVSVFLIELASFLGQSSLYQCRHSSIPNCKSEQWINKGELI